MSTCDFTLLQGGKSTLSGGGSSVGYYDENSQGIFSNILSGLTPDRVNMDLIMIVLIVIVIMIGFRDK